MSIFHQETQETSHITLNSWGARFALAIFGVISALIKLNIDLGG